MARQAAAMPTLFKRSDHGSYCFRRVVGTKRTTINTGTSDYSEAKKFLRNFKYIAKTLPPRGGAASAGESSQQDEFLLTEAVCCEVERSERSSRRMRELLRCNRKSW